MRHTTIGLIITLILGYFIYFLFSNNADANNLKQMGIKTVVVSMTDDLYRAMPLINKAGYALNAISIKATIPPLVIAGFTLEKKVSYQKQEAILSALEGNPIGKLALQSLIEAFRIDESMEIENMDLKGINLFLTFPPAVQVVYKK